MANFQCLKECFDELKKAKKKAITLEGELKRTKEDLILEHVTPIEEHKSFATVNTVVMEKVIISCDAMDKAQEELDEL